MIDEILRHLEALVAFDTRNPPRAIDGEGVFAYLRAQLPGFTPRVARPRRGCGLAAGGARDVRRACSTCTSTRCRWREGWSQDPFRLAVRDGRAIGLGACDIKGAAAGLLVAARPHARRCRLPVHQRRGGQRRALRRRPSSTSTRSSPRPWWPSRRARPPCSSHRGIVSAQARFRGIPGHASARRALGDSAVHRAVRVGRRRRSRRCARCRTRASACWKGCRSTSAASRAASRAT